MTATLLQKATSAIAVDFGACSMRAVQLWREGRRWRIHHWLNAEREPAEAESPQPDYDAELKMACTPGGFNGSRSVLLLDPPHVEFRVLEVPRAVLEQPAQAMRTGLQFELDRQIPWPTNECEIAAWPTQEGTSTQVSTMVVAARTAAVQQHLEILGAQRLNCVRADVLPNAVAGLWEPVAGQTAASVWGVLDLGFTSARLYLIHEGCPVYARVMRGGGRELTEALAKALRVEFRIAEQYKRIYGICQSDRGTRALVSGLARISEDALPAVLYAVLRPILESMVGDIERSYRFALGRLTTANAGPVLLAGAGARLKGLPEVLAAQLGIPVCLPTPGPQLDAASPASPGGIHPACSAMNFPVLSGCIGMALKEEEP